MRKLLTLHNVTAAVGLIGALVAIFDPSLSTVTHESGAAVLAFVGAVGIGGSAHVKAAQARAEKVPVPGPAGPKGAAGSPGPEGPRGVPGPAGAVDPQAVAEVVHDVLAKSFGAAPAPATVQPPAATPETPLPASTPAPQSPAAQ